MIPTKHSHSELYVHLVWTTQYRRPLLSEAFYAVIQKTLETSADKHNFDLIKAGGVEDHLHVLIRYRPDKPVANLARGIKASLTHAIRNLTEYPDFQWQTGYGAYSVSKSGLDKVIDYIARQSEHHKS